MNNKHISKEFVNVVENIASREKNDVLLLDLQKNLDKFNSSFPSQEIYDTIFAAIISKIIECMKTKAGLWMWNYIMSKQDMLGHLDKNLNEVIIFATIKKIQKRLPLSFILDCDNYQDGPLCIRYKHPLFLE